MQTDNHIFIYTLDWVGNCDSSILLFNGDPTLYLTIIYKYDKLIFTKRVSKSYCLNINNNILQY